MSWGIVAGIGGSIIGGLISSDGAQSAASTQAAGQAQSAAVQQQMFNITNENQRPWRQAGYNALSQFYPGGNAEDKTLGATLDPFFTKQFGPDDLKTNLAPNYQFMLDQGLGAVRNEMNARGGLVSGNLLKGVNDYAQNYASNAYQQAFQNYTANQTNIFNRLSNIAGLGQTANQATGIAATAAGQGIGNAYGNAASAQAAGQVGSANALGGAVNGANSWYQLSRMFPTSSDTGGNDFSKSTGGGINDFAE